MLRRLPEAKSRWDRAPLLGIHDPADVERCGVEKLVRIQLLQGSRIDRAGFDIPRDRDDRCALLPRVHQAVKQVSHAGTGCAAHGDGVSREVGLCHCREGAVLFIPHMHELDSSVAAQPVNDRIQSVSHDSVAPFHSRLCQHFPQQVCNVSRHKMPPLNYDSDFAYPIRTTPCETVNSTSRSSGPQLRIQSIAGTVIAKTSLELMSLAAVYDCRFIT